MKIFINQDEIDFTCESEKTLGDIYNSIEKWINPQGYSLTEIFIDSREYFFNKKEEWFELPFSGSEEFHFTALSLMDLKAQKLQTLVSYIELFVKALKEGNLNAQNELLSEYSYIENSFELLLDDSSHAIRDHMKMLLNENHFIPEDSRTDQNVMSVMEGFIMLEAVIRGRLIELTDPFKAGEETYDSIQTLLPRMEEVSLMLQTGKDREAMDIIIRFSELFQKLLRIYTNIPKEHTASHEKELKSFIMEMSGILKELADAFGSEDSVLMGDLMEYEIMPKMKNFPRFFETLVRKGE